MAGITNPDGTKGYEPYFMKADRRNEQLRKQLKRAKDDLAKARGLPTDSEMCQSCGSAVVLVWHATDEDWEKVVGDPAGLRCARCFAAKALEKGINLAFLAVPLENGWTEPQAHVARLEGEKAVLAAALDSYQKLEVGYQLACYWPSQEGLWLGCRSFIQFEEILRQREMAFSTLRAALSDTGKRWLSPEKVREVRGNVSMIDASPAGSLNAKCKAAALADLEVT